MKRRNAECGKLRRPLKRSKITEGIYGSTFLYLKFLLVWGLVLMADFLLEFRFEYLWPFWLLVRSVYDSFKYQGLAFSVFFVCVAVTSDMICYLFIPVQWLFFAASTYVWVQYVWHTERGICLPTVSLWLLFVYIEASVRLRELKSLPFYLDLCRPFAAHCIGYPVVTLGFGFKSYISYRLRLRKQKEIQKENEFYIQLLQKALPAEHENAEKQKALPSKQEEVISNGALPYTSSNSNSTGTSSTNSNTSQNTTTKKPSSSSTGKSDSSHTTTVPSPDKDKEKDIKKSGSTPHIEDLQYMEQTVHKKHNINHYNEAEEANEQNAKSFKVNGVTRTAKLNSQKDNVANRKGKPNNATTTTTTVFHNNKDEVIARLESDIRRLKGELASSRQAEQELRVQVGSLVLGDKAQRAELQQLRQDNDSLQTKLHNLVTSRQQDRQNLAQLERRLQDERRQRTQAEQQVSAERKAKKAEEANTARAVAMAAASRTECSENCKARRREQENELMQTRREVMLRQDQIAQLERETQTLLQYKDAQGETEVLMSALSALTDKNQHLESSLSSETRLKLDLFSALGDAKRQVEIQQGLLMQKELEVEDLQSKIAELLAVNPSPSTFSQSSASENSPRFSSSFTTVPTDEDVLVNSSLNPHASDYTPMLSQ